MSPEQDYPDQDRTESATKSVLDEQAEGGQNLPANHLEVRPEMPEVSSADGQGDTRVLDKDEALDGAYAQKPFVDAKLDHADNLTPVQKELLDWLGSEAAEKAMADYRAGKEQMTEAERAILERIDRFRTIGNTNREYTISQIHLGVNVPDRDNPETKKAKLDQAEALLGAVIDIKVAEVMGRDDLSEKQKLNELSSLLYAQSVVEEDLGVERGSGGRRSRDVAGLAREFVTHPESVRVALMLGKIVSGLVNREEWTSINAVESIAVITHSDFDKALAPYKLMIEQSYKEGHGHDIDNQMERHGYIWSEHQGKFLKLASEQ